MESSLTNQVHLLAIAVRINSIKPLPTIAFSMTEIPRWEARVFKVGVTSPLMKSLVLRSPSFAGRRQIQIQSYVAYFDRR